MNQYEKPFWNRRELVIGLDEAGRGPIAGELVVAGVVLPYNYRNEEINDSKKLSEKKREALYEVIVRDAIAYQVEIVSLEDIDRYNIYHATKRAMEKIVKDLDYKKVLTDAMPLDIPTFLVQSIIKGDQKSISIAAASILAKVTRDRMMREYDKQYPGYQFAKNKGYPTAEHLRIIQEIGICKIHRLSYQPVSQLKLDLGKVEE